LKKRDFFVAPKPTGRYLALLDKATREMRRRTDNKFFKCKVYNKYVQKI